MTQKEALKLALEALEQSQQILDEYMTECVTARQATNEAITAIKEALAQPEHSATHGEPVATDWERIARVQNAKLMAMCNEVGGFEKLREVMDKYEQTTPYVATPRPQRTWVGLTDEESVELMRQVPHLTIGGLLAIEAKLKAKNERSEKNTSNGGCV